ncbi:SMC-Scp complex subunit ScpB [Pseudalkalibacillus caeni]|uniref:Segregation and condensation protein B n=1 Tax=Exobacillus caeni TaxID=2574798 RepID=A0A5R9EZT7_9BACL|nr:SMC-Scp complex subunit ScpB [Pseudalkalibacillus caeni]TLS35640.1 SMC-Scp complex subunit ScpB [Pseudalkalibacillus caeni]
MELQELKAILEGLLFVAGEQGLTLKQVSEIIEIEEAAARELLGALQQELVDQKRGIRLVEMAGSYQLVTNSEHASYFQRLVESPSTTSLSQAALETLAIIAYNQPITRTEIEEIRGVKTEKPLQTLTAKLLIKEVGRAEGTGRAILYGTTKEFLQHFGLNNIKDLPKLPQENELQEEDAEADLFFEKFNKTIDNA